MVDGSPRTASMGGVRHRRRQGCRCRIESCLRAAQSSQAKDGRMMELTNAQLDAEVVRLDAKRSGPRIKLVPFDSIKLNTERHYLVKGIIPHPGLTVIWGPPKSGKSFWTSDLVLRVALPGNIESGA